MIPIHLRIAGFLSYRDPVELDFDSFELACISGQNGAGKSSLLDSFTWVLFGEARGKGMDIININQDVKAAEVVLTFKYEGNIYFLGVIAGVAPMMGFIGTISGVIKIFYNISLADNISISLISGGLYEKLITSGVGLSIGIIAYVSYHFLNNKINKMVQTWEYHSVRFIDLINSNRLCISEAQENKTLRYFQIPSVISCSF